MNKALLGLTTFAAAASVFISPNASAVSSYWMGFSDPRYLEGCVDSETNLRTSPEFAESNVRAILIDGSCGNFVVNQQRHLLYENGFYLLQFYFPVIDETRRYWIHESKILID